LARSDPPRTSPEKIEAQLVIARDLLEEATSLEIDVSKFKNRLSDLERMTPEKLGSPLASFMSDLSQAIEDFKQAEGRQAASMISEVEKQPTPLEAEVYEHLMKHGGLSVSAYSKKHGMTEEETKKAVGRLVELDMINVQAA